MSSEMQTSRESRLTDHAAELDGASNEVIEIDETVMAITQDKE